MQKLRLFMYRHPYISSATLGAFVFMWFPTTPVFWHRIVVFIIVWPIMLWALWADDR